MRAQILLLVVILLSSCQTSNGLSEHSKGRKIASLLNEQNIVLASETLSFEISTEQLELIPIDNSIINQVMISKSDDVSCINFKFFEETNLHIIYHIDPEKKFYCKAYDRKNIEAKFFINEKKMIENSFSKEIRSYLIDKVQNENYQSIIFELQQAGLSELFFQRVPYHNFNQLNLESGDFASISFLPFKPIKVYCEIEECIWANGEKVETKLNLNNLIFKYQFLPPFLLFCGPKYPAANIWMRSDSLKKFEKKIDNSGLNCDFNSISIIRNNFNFLISTYVIKKKDFSKILSSDVAVLSNLLNKRKIELFNEEILLIKQHLNAKTKLDGVKSSKRFKYIQKKKI